MVDVRDNGSAVVSLFNKRRSNFVSVSSSNRWVFHAAAAGQAAAACRVWDRLCRQTDLLGGSACLRRVPPVRLQL